MGYIRAEEILPIEVIELIQQYVDGENIYIPRKPSNRQAWEQVHRLSRNFCGVINRFTWIFLQGARLRN